MATLPEKHLVERIYEARESESKVYDSTGINMSSAGHECLRSLFYDLRWVSPQEPINGRTMGIFATGNWQEERLIADLSKAGFEIVAEQIRVMSAGNFLRGYADVVLGGVPGEPENVLCEIKSMNDRNFKQLIRHGIQKAQPKHYFQMQIYGYELGFNRVGYFVVNKNTDELYWMVYDVDRKFVESKIRDFEKFIYDNRPPAKLGDSADKYPCRFCQHKDVCHEDAMPRINCRTCVHVKAVPKRGWFCDKHRQPLDYKECQAGCVDHLFEPKLIPGEVNDASDEEYWVEYNLNNKKVWRDTGGVTK